MSIKLSVVILTKNNQETIQKCVKSVLFADEIIIIDDYSQDQTIEEVSQVFDPHAFDIKFPRQAKPQLKILKNHLEQDFAKARNFGLEQARGEWVLFIDSDEYISKQLKNEIINSLNLKSIDGFYFKRQDIFLNNIVRHGETNNIKILRLGKRLSGKWMGKVHEIWKINGQKKFLKNPIIHERKFTLSQFLDRLDFYSTLQAQEFYQQNKIEHFCRLFLNPIGKFINNYFLKLGFLDGSVGIILALCMSWHSFLVRLKLQIMNKNHGNLEFKPLK